jgi:EipB-like
MFAGRRLMKRLKAIGAASVLLALAGAGAAAAQGPRVAAVGAVRDVALASHVAVYELALARSDSEGIVGLRGRLAMEIVDTCDGFTTTQRIHMETVDAAGGQSVNDFRLSSWESRDGLKFRFTLSNDTDGRRTEEFAGLAELQGLGKGGVAKFDKPEGLRLDLPAGTVFPTEHLAAVIAAAKAGKDFIAIKLFDGGGDDGVYEVSGVIAKVPAGAADDGAVLAPVKALPKWRVRLAYFPLASKGDGPQYEVGLRLYDNGVSDQLLIDYGEFAMKGTLIQLDLMPQPDC